MSDILKTISEHRNEQLSKLYRNGVCLLPDTARRSIAKKIKKTTAYVGRCLNPKRNDYNQKIIDMAFDILFADQEKKRQEREAIDEKILKIHK